MSMSLFMNCLCNLCMQCWFIFRYCRLPMTLTLVWLTLQLACLNMRHMKLFDVCFMTKHKVHMWMWICFWSYHYHRIMLEIIMMSMTVCLGSEPKSFKLMSGVPFPARRILERMPKAQSKVDQSRGQVLDSRWLASQRFWVGTQFLL
jgi:hypothetical protein